MSNIIKFIAMVLCMMVILTACLIRDACSLEEMEITSNGETIKPMGYTIWSEGDGVSVDHVPVDKLAIKDELDSITYSEDYSEKYSIEPKAKAYYNLFDSDFEPLESNIHSLDDLSEGDYIVCAVVIWENGDDRSGVEYYYKLQVE